MRAAATIAALIVAAYAVVAYLRGAGTMVPNQSLIEFGGVTAVTLRRGEWWRLLTSQFLHVYLLHALLNATAILIVGSIFERAAGPARCLAICAIAGTIGQLVAVGVFPTIVATGASNAALGLAAATIAMAIGRRSLPLATAPAAYLIIAIVLDLVAARTIKWPHVAALLAGLGAHKILR